MRTLRKLMTNFFDKNFAYTVEGALFVLKASAKTEGAANV